MIDEHLKKASSRPLTFIPKAKDEHFAHFNIRLEERYGIKVNKQEYDELSKLYKGLASRGMHSIGYVFIKDTKVWVRVLTKHYGKGGYMLTCYPANVETDVDSFILFYFRKSHRPLAYALYNQYLQEDLELSKITFKSDKEFFIHVRNNFVFYQIHGYKRTGKLTFFKMFAVIDKVINCKSSFLTIKAVNI
jgi:hypothetical protein